MHLSIPRFKASRSAAGCGSFPPLSFASPSSLVAHAETQAVCSQQAKREKGEGTLTLPVTTGSTTAEVAATAAEQITTTKQPTEINGARRGRTIIVVTYSRVRVIGFDRWLAGLAYTGARVMLRQHPSCLTFGVEIEATRAPASVHLQVERVVARSCVLAVPLVPISLVHACPRLSL